MLLEIQIFIRESIVCLSALCLVMLGLEHHEHPFNLVIRAN